MSRCLQRRHYYVSYTINQPSGIRSSNKSGPGHTCYVRPTCARGCVEHKTKDKHVGFPRPEADRRLPPSARFVVAYLLSWHGKSKQSQANRLGGCRGPSLHFAFPASHADVTTIFPRTSLHPVAKRTDTRTLAQNVYANIPRNNPHRSDPGRARLARLRRLRAKDHLPRRRSRLQWRATHLFPRMLDTRLSRLGLVGGKTSPKQTITPSPRCR